MNSIKMALERYFNAICFYSKLNRFVLSSRKKIKPFRFKNSSGWFCRLYMYRHVELKNVGAKIVK